MPLRAFLNGQEIISIGYTDAEWKALRDEIASGKLLTLPCCHQPGFLRTSSKKLKHFVHSKSDNICNWKPETAEHLASKVEIVRACEANGWKARPEFSENDWRADVLAEKNGNRIAFEIQWSKQTMEETIFRQQRYKNANVRGCWFFRVAPKQMRSYENAILASKETPSFSIKRNNDGNISIDFSNRTFSLYDFVEKLLNKKIRFCENYRLASRQEVEIIVFETSCWKCKQNQQLYTVNQNLKAMCQKDLQVYRSMWDNDDLDKSPPIVSAVEEIMRSQEGNNIKIGQIKKRYSKMIAGDYLSYGCYYCDVLFGDFFLTDEKLHGMNDPNKRIFRKVVDLSILIQPGEHWCYSESGEFCEQHR